jgi:rifampicin phosphotransferase
MPESTTADPDAFELPPEADRSQLWLHDGMHFPAPLPVLAFEAIQRWIGRGLGGGLARVNGYGYMRPPSMPSDEGESPGGWEAVHLPRVRAIDATIRGRDYAAMGPVELVAALPGVFDEAAAAFRETMVAMGETGATTMPFIAFCQAELAPDGALLAMTMLQGLENASAASAQRLGALAELAREIPPVAEALQRGDLAILPALPAAAPFIAAFEAYLDEYGRGTTTWFEIQKPTWTEQPEVPLRIIARYVASPELSPAAAHLRSREQRAAAVVEAESRLDASQLDQFRALLARAQEYVPIVEGRALWQLRAAGSLRLPVMALGRHLASTGAIDQPEDVFHFSLAELRAHIEGSSLPDLRPLARARRADLDRWSRLIPPASLGLPVPAAVLAAIPEMQSLFGFRLRDGLAPLELVGSAASRGTARAVARVIRDIDDADRLEPGEILVCPFTAPPWTPLFAIAAAVVTDAGGVLSHSAIAAREYGIPCVCGTGDGTRRVPDGAIINVDGTNGTVTIEG